MADHEELINPYAAPTETDRGPGESTLAGRWSRLVATLVDVIFVGLILLPLLYFAGIFETLLEEDESLAQTLMLSFISSVIFLVLNGWLLVKQGQTIGKVIFNIKIVRRDDSLADIYQIIGLRTILFAVLTASEKIGMLFLILDSLFIFRSDRRCIHDLVAGTKVVKV